MYVLAMTTTTERLMEEIKRLEMAELIEVCQAVNSLVNALTPRPQSTSLSAEQSLEAVRRLFGCTNGANSLDRLLAERACDREREEGKIRAYSTRRTEGPDA